MPGQPGWRRVGVLPQGTALGTVFPEVRDAVELAVPANSIVDGEIVFWGRGDRLDFSALVRRMGSGTARAGQLAVTQRCTLVLSMCFASAERICETGR